MLYMVAKNCQEWIKIHLVNYFESNKILLDNHHRGHNNYSTNSAKSAIDYNLGKGMENFNLTCMINTDMSSAFDTVDHEILIEKHDHYGLRGKESRIIKSFLSDRKQYVNIDGKESELLDSLKCSVIQGSKLSSLLYILYTNEIPLLYKLVGTPLMTLFIKITPVLTTLTFHIILYST